jgi:hypothetical protein
MNISFLSFIDIYSDGGIKVLHGRSFLGVSAFHKENQYAGNQQTEKGMSGFSLPFFFLNMVWLLQGFRG